MKRAVVRPDVGVRDLKTHASAEAPLPPDETWQRLEKLGSELDRDWKTRKTSTTAIAEIRNAKTAKSHIYPGSLSL